MSNKNRHEKYKDDVPYEAVRWIKIIFAAVLCACIGIPTASHIADARSDDFDITKGFDETQQEKVWATYNVTDWEKVGGLLFTDDSLIMLDKEVQDSDFAKNNEKDVAKALKEFKGKTYYKKSSYEKLFFAMAYAITRKGTAMLPAETNEDISKDALKEANEAAGKVSADDQGSAGQQADDAAKKLDDLMNGNNNDKKKDSVDWLFAHDIYGTENPKSAKESAEALIRNYFSAENEYLHVDVAGYHREDMDYFIDDSNNTSGLKCVLQAAIYGNNYVTYKKQFTYSKDKSEKYRKDNPNDARVTFDDFADQVLKHYKATPIKNSSETKIEG